MNELTKHPVFRFLLISAITYGLWLLLYYLIIKPHTSLDYYLDYNIVWLSQQLLDVFGSISFIDIESDHVVLILDGSNRPGVWVGDECNGFKLFAIFTIFILAFPGKVKTKFWFIPMGIVLIHAANIIRVVALLLIDSKFPRFLDFNHNYTFTIFVYLIIFLLWWWWAKKYSHVKKS